MKGQSTLPSDVIGWTITIAIFVGGMVGLLALWFGFQTLPTESVEKSTACDLGYMLSLWEEATVYPNVFDKSFLESWEEDETAGKIFENMSDSFFIPDSDFFVYVSDGKKIHSLYIPPESESVFKNSRLYMLPSELKKFKESGLMEALPSEEGITEIENYGDGEKDEKEYRTKLSHYNELYSICHLVAFVADKDTDKVVVESMAAGMTTNLATRLRDGIYRVGVKGDTYTYYHLGSYPEGCMNYGYADEIKTKRLLVDIVIPGRIIFHLPFIKEAAAWLDEGIEWTLGKIPIFGGIYKWFKKVEEKSIKYITTTEIHADCGFNWNWDEENRVLSVVPSTIWDGKIELKTRIPEKIVEDSELSKKICKPKGIRKDLFTAPGGLYNYEFFLKVENMKPEGEWREDSQMELCQKKCDEDSPWWFSGVAIKNCKKSCAEFNNPDNLNDMNYCKEKHGFTEGKAVCEIARDYYYLYENLPLNAIDIKYIAVEQDKLAEFDNVEEFIKSGNYEAESACSIWPGIFDCAVAGDCAGTHCVSHECSLCHSDNLYDICSPNYLEYPPSVDDKLYTCQKVDNHLWPSREPMYECLPKIQIEKICNGKNIDEMSSIDCSKTEYKNAEITWKINATGLCCRKLIPMTDEEGNVIKDEKGNERLVCEETEEHCQELKFWPNIDSSNVAIFDDKRYIFKITQKVCRDGMPYNNALSAFIVSNYPVKDRVIEYSLMDSEVELLPKVKAGETVKNCEFPQISMACREQVELIDGNCYCKICRISNKIFVKEARYEDSSCNISDDFVPEEGAKTYCGGKCKITNTLAGTKGEVCLEEIN